MAVSNLSRRLLQVIRNALNQKLKYHTKLKVAALRDDGKKTLIARTLHHTDTKPILYRINLAHFYNGSSPLYNVSTYENLVNQKSNSSSNKKCPPTDNAHPGRHKFHQEVEAALNEQVEVEFNACFAYLSMASYFGRTEVALPGCQGFFMMMHQEEHEHAVIFLNYILMRGGHVKVPTISPPDNPDWKDISKTFAVAVEMESQVKEKLEALIDLSTKHGDHQLIDFVSSQFLEEQNKSIQSIGRLFTRSKMAKSDVGEHLFDQHIYDSFVKHSKDNLMYATDLPQEEAKKIYK